MCLYPRLIENRKYKANKKNGGDVPPVKDERVKYVPVGCGKCIECRKQKSREWQVRLHEEIKQNKNGKFITLTFSDDAIAAITEKLQIQHREGNIEMPVGYDLDNAIATYAVRKFNERYRKRFKVALRHWLVTELGHQGTENIHIHGIVWTDENYNTIKRLWNYGYIYPRTEEEQKLVYTNARTVNYIIKYVHKIDKDHPNYKSKILTSPGIGNRYTQTIDATKNKFKGIETNETYRASAGNKIALPTYYRNRIYTEEEKEKLWLQKLDKQERYVLGTKVSIKDNEDEYLRAVKYARKTNTELGYGDDSKNYEQEQYERELRIIKQKTRIAKADRTKKQRNSG